jgi:hypothetical protein
MSVGKASKTFVKTSCYALSAVAFVGLLYVQGVPAHAYVELREDTPPHLNARALQGPSTAAPATPRAAAVAAQPGPAAAAPKVEAPAPAALQLPDFKGKRLSLVRREAKKLGLKVIARDEYGQRVSADLAQYYRVRKQLMAAGKPLVAGSTLEVKVREVVDYASGY